MQTINAINPVTNDAERTIGLATPYVVEIQIQGTSDFLFHRWNNESIAEKAAARKGSAAKKCDDVESYVFRDDEGHLCVPGEYLRQATIHAAKYRQDPRSPRKSAMDLYKAGVIALTNLATTGKATWDYLDRRRVVIQRNGVTRERPALKAGWKCSIQLQCNLPEYITPAELNETVQMAGKLIGLGDFRPTFGRFQVTSFQLL